jgi:hypothetical protein
MLLPAEQSLLCKNRQNQLQVRNIQKGQIFPVINYSHNKKVHKYFFYVHVTVHRDKFPYNKTNQMH